MFTSFLMIALLSILARGSSLMFSEPKNPNACFDLTFVDSNGNEKDTTMNDEGYLVGFRVHEDEKPGETKFLKYSDDWYTNVDDLDVSFNAEPKYDAYIVIECLISNTGYWPKTIDIGVFADSGFAGNDNSTVQLHPNGRGLKISSPDSPIFYSILTDNEGTYPQVDTTFIGDLDNDKTSDPQKLPFFTNHVVEKTTGDSVFAFSWMNREIKPGETLIIGFSVHHNTDSHTPPRIVDNTIKKEFYDKNEITEVNFTVYDDDPNEKITIQFEYPNGTSVVEKFTTTETQKSKFFSRKVNVGRGSIFTYNINAYDSLGYNSNNLYSRFVIAKPPKVKELPKIKDRYIMGEKIHVIMKAEEEDYREFRYLYQFNNGQIESSYYPEFDITIPEPIKTGKRYTLNLWVSDDYGVNSIKYPFRFAYAKTEDEVIPEDPKPTAAPTPKPVVKEENKPAKKEDKPNENDKSKENEKEGKSRMTEKNTTNDPSLKEGANSSKDDTKLILSIVLPTVCAIFIVGAGIVYLIHKKMNKGQDDKAKPINEEQTDNNIEI